MRHVIHLLLHLLTSTALTVRTRPADSATKNRYDIRGAGRLFLDTANVADMQAFLPLGIFHGVTTNPTLLEQAGVECSLDSISAFSKQVFELGAGELMLQTWGADADQMIKTGFWLSSLDPAQVVVKVPVTSQGTIAAAELTRNGVRVCMTACYAREQALVAANLGAEYLAPYLGRMTDAGKNGHDEVYQMQSIMDGLGAHTRILVASIRDVSDLSSLAAASIDTFTFSPTIAQGLFGEPLTIAAAAEFEAAAQRNSAAAPQFG